MMEVERESDGERVWEQGIVKGYESVLINKSVCVRERVGERVCVSVREMGGQAAWERFNFGGDFRAIKQKFFIL